MKILAFAASNSKESINSKLAQFAANLVDGAQVEMLDLNDYEMPLFSVDREKALGQPEQAKRFFSKIGAADAIIISFAEHNGTYTAAYKNLFDWTSRISQKVFQDKPMVYLSTSPGPGGAGSVLSAATASALFFAANVRASVSVPSFYENFDVKSKQVINTEIKKNLEQAVKMLCG